MRNLEGEIAKSEKANEPLGLQPKALSLGRKRSVNHKLFRRPSTGRERRGHSRLHNSASRGPSDDGGGQSQRAA